jgi:hypothetical protein
MKNQPRGLSVFIARKWRRMPFPLRAEAAAVSDFSSLSALPYLLIPCRCVVYQDPAAGAGITSRHINWTAHLWNIIPHQTNEGRNYPRPLALDLLILDLFVEV